MSDFLTRRAEKMIQAGMKAVSEGLLPEARIEFRAAAELVPTAPALTYWGWMEHHLGDTERAIELCRQAIELDPDFGNPYNDIGSYLVSLGREDEAISWFQEAIEAPDYEPRQFPHVNLGRIYLRRRQVARAIQHLEEAARLCPEDPEIAGALRRARGMATAAEREA